MKIYYILYQQLIHTVFFLLFKLVPYSILYQLCNFRLYENTKSDKENKPVGLQTQVQLKSDTSTLKQKLLSLKQDKTVRNELEPAFQAFIKKPRPFEQCLLSLL